MSRDVYQKHYCTGDKIDNVKLATAIIDFTAAHDALLKLGPCFEVSRKEIGQCLLWLESVQRARANK